MPQTCPAQGHILHSLTLPDGSVLFSGQAEGQAAIRSLSVTETVNTGEELCPGAVCAASLEAEIWAPADASGRSTLRLTAGQELLCSRLLPDGTAQPLGLFIAEQPTRATAHTYRLTAYDRVTRCDTDLSAWLRAQRAAFPMPLYAFARAVCAQCGLELANTELPNGDWPVPPITATAVTGRQLLQWVGQVAGRFGRATADGRLEFAWYTPVRPWQSAAPGAAPLPARLRLAGQTLRTADADPAAPPDGPLIFRVQDPPWYYYAGTLQYEDFATAPLERVLLRQSESDAGTAWPPTAAAGNTFTVTGNPLLAGADAAALQAVARGLYGQLHALCYTPCRMRLPALSGLRAGKLLQVTDPQGRTFTTCVMTCCLAGDTLTAESTGSPRRDSATAVNDYTNRALQGRVLEVRTGIDGLTSTAQQLQDVYGRLEQTVGGFALTASEGSDGRSARVALCSGQTVLSSADVRLRDAVRFADLEGSGATAINADNITGGCLQNAARDTAVDLDAGRLLSRGAGGTLTLQGGALCLADHGGTPCATLALQGGEALLCLIGGACYAQVGPGRLAVRRMAEPGTVAENDDVLFEVDATGACRTGTVRADGLTAASLNGETVAWKYSEELQCLVLCQA